MVNETTSKNSEGSFEPFNIEDIPWAQFPGSDRSGPVGI